MIEKTHTQTDTNTKRLTKHCERIQQIQTHQEVVHIERVEQEQDRKHKQIKRQNLFYFVSFGGHMISPTLLFFPFKYTNQNKSCA